MKMFLVIAFQFSSQLTGSSINESISFISCVKTKCKQYFYYDKLLLVRHLFQTMKVAYFT